MSFRPLFRRLRLQRDGTRAETRFGLSTKRTSPFKSAGGVSSVDYWQASCAHQPAGFVLLVQSCVLQSCDAYWLPTPFSCFPFTSPPIRHRVPSHFNWSLPPKVLRMQNGLKRTYDYYSKHQISSVYCFKSLSLVFVNFATRISCTLGGQLTCNTANEISSLEGTSSR